MAGHGRRSTPSPSMWRVAAHHTVDIGLYCGLFGLSYELDAAEVGDTGWDAWIRIGSVAAFNALQSYLLYRKHRSDKAYTDQFAEDVNALMETDGSDEEYEEIRLMRSDSLDQSETTAIEDGAADTGITKSGSVRFNPSITLIPASRGAIQAQLAPPSLRHNLKKSLWNRAVIENFIRDNIWQLLTLLRHSPDKDTRHALFDMAWQFATFLISGTAIEAAWKYRKYGCALPEKEQGEICGRKRARLPWQWDNMKQAIAPAAGFVAWDIGGWMTWLGQYGVSFPMGWFENSAQLAFDWNWTIDNLPAFVSIGLANFTAGAQWCLVALALGITPAGPAVFIFRTLLLALTVALQNALAASTTMHDKRYFEERGWYTPQAAREGLIGRSITFRDPTSSGRGTAAIANHAHGQLDQPGHETAVWRVDSDLGNLGLNAPLLPGSGSLNASTPPGRKPGVYANAMPTRRDIEIGGAAAPHLVDILGSVANDGGHGDVTSPRPCVIM